MTKQTSMQEETDEDLFLYMACADSPTDKPLADEAFAEIHRRYIKHLYARCLRMVSSYPDSETMAEDLASAALTRAYDRAETYTVASESSTSTSRTIAWLSKIALNIYRDHLRNQLRPGPLNVIDLNVYPEDYSPINFAALYCHDKPQLNTQEEYRLVAEAFDTLDERIRRVLIETLEMREKSPSGRYMLRGTAKQLAERLGTTTFNLRRIRMRGIQYINNYVIQHKHNDEDGS